MNDQAMKPVITVEDFDQIKFENKCQELIEKGYKLEACACGFIDSEEYEFCDNWQAIFVHPDVLKCPEIGDLFDRVVLLERQMLAHDHAPQTGTTTITAIAGNSE